VAESTSVQVDRGAGVQLDYGYPWRLLGRGSFLAIGNFAFATPLNAPAPGLDRGTRRSVVTASRCPLCR
jgi:hypothetical protein